MNDLAQAIIAAMPTMPDQIKPRWATVTSMSPLRIRLDGEASALALDPIDLVGVATGQRVWTMLYAGQVYILGAYGGQRLPAGVVQALAIATVPTGWLKCDGTIYNITDYPALGGALLSTYGGNGTTTFAVPNLNGRTIVGVNPAQTEFDVLGETGGERTHTLSVSEMPTHNHSADTTGDYNGNALQGSSAYLGPKAAPGAGNYYYLAGDGSQVGTASFHTSIGNMGNGAAHNNLQPYMALNWIIKT